MIEELQAQIRDVCQNLYQQSPKVILTRPEEQFGDFATNVALQLAKPLGKNPRQVAEAIAEKLPRQKSEYLSEVVVAGPGFINIHLSDNALLKNMNQTVASSLKGQNIVFEYSDPNPFKVLHAGHLYQTVVGDSIAKLLEAAGAGVHRVNFGGDVGRHVAITMWAILKDLGGAYPEKLNDIPVSERSNWMAAAYIKGTQAFEESGQAGGDTLIKTDILALNKIIYNYYSRQRSLLVLELPSSLGTDPNALKSENIIEIYKVCRQWSYDYFDKFYASIGSGFEKYYPESVTAPLGLKTVLEQLEKGVYEKSDGAVVFKGEPYGLHTRVFINSEGLPTYEAKDVGLTMAKWQDYHFDRTIIITGNDITEYMKVVLKSIEQFAPDLSRRTTHLTHGQVKLVGGVKMSSRKGNILRAQDVLDSAKEASQTLNDNEQPNVVLGAVKYSFIRQAMGPDIIYDPAESVSIHGNSGPYLQYAHARARSILGKAEKPVGSQASITTLEVGERSLVRKISEYAEVVDKAVEELTPHIICTYLYELAQTFNRFYENNRVIGDPRQAIRLELVKSYADKLKDGLQLLNISAPEKM